MTTTAIVLLAAGQGTRMNSKYQKILHQVGGKPMVLHLFEAAEAIADLPPVVVVGPGGDGVRHLLGERATYVVQAEQLGTGHAALMAQPLLAGQTDQVIITYGDMPLLRRETLHRLAQRQADSDATIVMLTVLGSPDSAFGRVVRGDEDQVMEIVEVAEAKKRPNPDTILNIRELNAGVYCFAADWLWHHLDKLPLRQARSGPEYYLTDLIETAVGQNRHVEALITDDADECLGAGTRTELVAVEKAFRRRANQRWLDNGVTLIDPDTTYIDPDVIIGQDTVIWPNSYIQGDSTIGADCIIGPNTIIRSATIGNGCRIVQSTIERVFIEDGRQVGPFSHIWDTP
jgi:bifunctional UDP-N-acetylglucosamine pyrophosphorylase / glucosamine-1-phosphate N-acetyltransferase